MEKNELSAWRQELGKDEWRRYSKKAPFPFFYVERPKKSLNVFWNRDLQRYEPFKNALRYVRKIAFWRE